MKTTLKQVVLVAGIFLVAGCGGTGDAGLSLDGGGDTSSDSGVGGDTSLANAPFMVLDIATGQRTTVASIADLGSNASYRSTSMVFRRVKSASDEFWMGVFEVTQAQWQGLAGSSSTPWAGVDTTVVGANAVADDKPAFNLSYDLVQSALGTYNSVRSTKLGIPSDAQWAVGCAAGGTGVWSWGDASDRSVIATYAAVLESQSGVAGPRSVGGRTANPFGLHDMHGNVWELTSPAGSLRGGSWYDSAVQARTGNQLTFAATGLTAGTAHALLGVRLTIQP
jgi:formylglycine-generating enzyme required for sulfatase activity